MKKAKSSLSGAKVADAIEQSWVYRLLPQNIWPYAQLARWERPIGWWLLMWPGWWSIMLANIAQHPSAIPDANGANTLVQKLTAGALSFSTEILPTLLLFALGAIVMRGAGCTYNDIADQDIDDQVARTRSRPLPSGRVNKKQAWFFLILQLLVGLVILLQFNTYSFFVGFLSLITIIIYPFMKRVTWWPQLFLGLAFSWGALLGWSVELGALSLAPFLLYLGSISWVIGYDTIYAHQDKEDDALAGVKSTARLFGTNTKLAISILYLCALLLLAAAITMAICTGGALCYGSLPAFVALFIAALHMMWQIMTLDINDSEQCLKLFQSNSYFGWILFSGFCASYLLSFVQ